MKHNQLVSDFRFVCEPIEFSKFTEKALLQYFYPSVNTLEHIVDYDAPTPVSEDISKRILCLPLYWKLEDFTADRIR